MTTALEKYLKIYAEPEVALAQTVSDRFSASVIIPISGEDSNVFTLLESLEQASRFSALRTLAIIVINARENSPEAVHHLNEAQLSHLKDWKGEPLSLLVVDRASPGRRLPPKQGVGLARKIGCDIAASLWVKQNIQSPFIRTTDADVRVPVDYFVEPEGSSAAVLFPFAHTTTEASLQAQAHQLYEIFLRYYVVGLTYAKSPYAFHTIGSTLAVHAGAYGAVRGFPKREAGEDFYLLNKLAKVGRIVSLRGGELRITPRNSSRVPFGTGRATARIADELGRGKEFFLYHPKSFELLRGWLEALGKFARHRDIENIEKELADCGITPIVESFHYRQALEIACRTRKTSEELLRHLHTWFDGFKTLKFIHAVRDTLLPPISYREALAEGWKYFGKGVVAFPS